MAARNLEQSQIYLDLVNLRWQLQQMQFLMNKPDRIAYATPLIAMVGECIADFACAYSIPPKRSQHAASVLGKFTVVRNDLRQIFEHGLLVKRDNVTHGCRNSATTKVSVDSIQFDIAEILARIDKGVGNYVAYAVTPEQDRKA